MADTSSMNASEAAGKMLASEHADVLREAVRLMLIEIMEGEVAELAGGERYERSAERLAQRNGYRQRQWDTRVGSLELAIPRLRSGSYFPSFLEPRRRSEQALVAVVAEAYVNGVSTRKVERLVAQLGIESMSRSTVSRLCKTLDEQVRIFRERPLAAYSTPSRTVIPRQAEHRFQSKPNTDSTPSRTVCEPRVEPLAGP